MRRAGDPNNTGRPNGFLTPEYWTLTGPSRAVADAGDMPLADRIVAVVVLGGTGGTVAFRSWRAWREYRIQRRALDILVRSMTEVEDPQQKAPTQ